MIDDPGRTELVDNDVLVIEFAIEEGGVAAMRNKRNKKNANKGEKKTKDRRWLSTAHGGFTEGVLKVDASKEYH